jgi:hypothetical protein
MSGILPIVIGPANCLAATGWPWRWIRDTAPRLGVPLLVVGRKQGVRADLLLAALERAGATATSAEQPMAHADPAEAIRRSLGLRRVAK